MRWSRRRRPDALSDGALEGRVISKTKYELLQARANWQPPLISGVDFSDFKKAMKADLRHRMWRIARVPLIAVSAGATAVFLAIATLVTPPPSQPKAPSTPKPPGNSRETHHPERVIEPPSHVLAPEREVPHYGARSTPSSIDGLALAVGL